MSNPDPFSFICLAVALLAVLWGFAAERRADRAEQQAKAANEDAEAARTREGAAIEDALKVGRELQVARKRAAANLELVRDQGRTIKRLEGKVAELEQNLEWDRYAVLDADMKAGIGSVVLGDLTGDRRVEGQEYGDN